MTCKEFIDQLDNSYFFDNLCDELHWDSGYQVEVIWRAILTEANILGIKLVDKDTYAYDNELFEIYSNTEKGLS